MSRNRKVVIVLTFLFFAVFSGMVIAGTHLTYKSVTNEASSETNVKLNVSKDSVELEFTTAIPGIVLIIFGSVGLLIMLIKVPTKEIVGYKDPHDSGNGNTMNFLLGALASYKPIYSHNITKIPLPIWWLIRSKGIFFKVGKNA